MARVIYAQKKRLFSRCIYAIHVITHTQFGKIYKNNIPRIVVKITIRIIFFKQRGASSPVTWCAHKIPTIVLENTIPRMTQRNHMKRHRSFLGDRSDVSVRQRIITITIQPNDISIRTRAVSWVMRVHTQQTKGDAKPSVALLAPSYQKNGSDHSLLGRCVS
jgi:hypothetical protein